ncbi:MAG: electron transfer flavoprotein subunit alpha/FixB family protein [Thermodesulfobacteriota bacterium]
MNRDQRFVALVVLRARADGCVPLDGLGLALAMGFPLDSLACALVSTDAEKSAPVLAQQTGAAVLPVSGPGLPGAGALQLAVLLQGIMERLGCGLALFGPGLWAMETAPVLAALRGAAFVPGVSGVSRSPVRGFSFLRPVMNGKLNLSLRAGGESAVCTVTAGAFSFSRPPDAPPGRVIGPGVIVSGSGPRWRPVSESPSDPGLTQADVVVTAGRGVGAAENMAMIEDTAALFARSAVAGSRSACDAGLVPVSRQVGMTGKSVSPKLYLACGVSGARQHTCGFSGASFVAAVNRDPAAPIFRVSDICIQEDLTRFLPELVRICKEARQKA